MPAPFGLHQNAEGSSSWLCVAVMWISCRLGRLRYAFDIVLGQSILGLMRLLDAQQHSYVSCKPSTRSPGAATNVPGTASSATNRLDVMNYAT